MQQKALKQKAWTIDDAVAEFGRHARLVLGGLLKQGLMYAQGTNRWARTATGTEILGLLNGSSK